MRPIWQYYNQNYSYRIDTTPVFPAYEVSFTDHNLINPLPRFLSIFLPLLESDICYEKRIQLENILIHCLALFDLNYGKNYRELYLKQFHDELLSGLWGSCIKNIYSALNNIDQRFILNLLFEQEIKFCFCLERALTYFFPETLLYRIIESEYIIIAIHSNKDEINENKIKLILDLFAPIRQHFYVLWQNVPCILDEREGFLGTCVLC